IPGLSWQPVLHVGLHITLHVLLPFMKVEQGGPRGMFFEVVADNLLHNDLTIVEFGEPGRMRQRPIRIRRRGCRAKNYCVRDHSLPLLSSNNGTAPEIARGVPVERIELNPSALRVCGEAMLDTVNGRFAELSNAERCGGYAAPQWPPARLLQA